MPPARPPRFLVGTLAVTVSVAYGAMFYGFSVLITDEAAGGVFSATVLSAAFGGAVITGGAAAVAVGRWADRAGVRPIVATGGVVGGAGLVGFAAATETWHVLAVWWLVLGPATAMTFYEPAYVAVNQWVAPERRVRAIATLTLLAGLSGPVSLPVTAALVAAVGWRGATVALGAALALCCGAAALFVIPPGAGTAGPRPGRSDAAPGPAPAWGRDRRLLTFTAAAVLAYGSMEAVVVHRVARFEEAGFAVATATAWAAAAGLLSLPGRFVLPSLASRLAPTRILAGVLLTVTAAVLLAVGGTTHAELAGHFALFGLVFGAALPLRAVVMSDWYGGPTFGRVMGVQAAVLALGRAGAPALTGATRDVVGGYALPMALLAAAIAAGAVLTLVSARVPAPAPVA